MIRLNESHTAQIINWIRKTDFSFKIVVHELMKDVDTKSQQFLFFPSNKIFFFNIKIWLHTQTLSLHWPQVYLIYKTQKNVGKTYKNLNRLWQTSWNFQINFFLSSFMFRFTYLLFMSIHSTYHLKIVAVVVVIYLY